jgi:hypothetical protein
MPAAVVMATVADPLQAASMRPAAMQAKQRHMAVQRNSDDRLGDAAILQNSSKASASAHQQRDGRRWRKALIAESQNRRA